MKNIAICCDGTWNTPDDCDGDVPTPTNVVRLFNALADFDEQGIRQHKYYHPGVGTNGSWWDKVMGGGTGRGLDRNIMGAYRELCDHYEEGDHIFLFGFSRGAYTVRSLSGMIARCGLLRTEGLDDAKAWQRIEHVFQEGYRRRRETRESWVRQDWEFHKTPGSGDSIRFLGVWDTVGALGIPDDMGVLNLLDNLHDYTFHDTELGESVQTARHAVALDEIRASFQPTLWTQTGGRDIEQIWFPGVHSDVGGGYRETGLADGALGWMIGQAKVCKLAFSQPMLDQIKPDHRDVLHDSCKGVFAVMPTQPRSAPAIRKNGVIHPSALERQLAPPIVQSPYRPELLFAAPGAIEIDIYSAQPWNYTGLWLEADVTYVFQAVGEWLDSSIKCGPEGTNDGNFQPAELVQVAGSALGYVEGWFKKVTGNGDADFRFTKRHERFPWFCLVGAISNGGGVDAKEHLAPHEAFEIGAGCTYTPLNSGYFYAYANDAWNCYGNNRGYVRLTIARK